MRAYVSVLALMVICSLIPARILAQEAEENPIIAQSSCDNWELNPQRIGVCLFREDMSMEVVFPPEGDSIGASWWYDENTIFVAASSWAFPTYTEHWFFYNVETQEWTGVEDWPEFSINERDTVEIFDVTEGSTSVDVTHQRFPDHQVLIYSDGDGNTTYLNGEVVCQFYCWPVWREDSIVFLNRTQILIYHVETDEWEEHEYAPYHLFYLEYRDKMR